MRDRLTGQTGALPYVDRSSSALAGFDETTTAFVIEHLTEELFAPGQVVFEDNTDGDTLYIVKSGRVQVSKRLESGLEHILAEMAPGEFFGEMALLEAKPRSATVKACTQTCLLSMSRRTFNTLIEEHPTVAINFLKIISARLRERTQMQELLLQEKQCLVEELAGKNTALEDALAELREAMQTVAEHERVKRDLEIAHEIQQQMLPSDFPALPGVQVYGTTVPSRWVGGDFFDVVCLDTRLLGVLLGDVAGKGVPAAIQMARLMGEFRACVSHCAEPEYVAQTLSGLLWQRNKRRASFVTMQYLLLDQAQQTLQFVCAGHPPILLSHADGATERLGALPNLPLGIDDQFIYRQESYQLSPGDRLLLYSDGAYELQNAEGDMLGLSRLVELFARSSGSPTDTIEVIQQNLDRFSDMQRPHDDTTLLCICIDE
ncbi:MAG: SpoIIE family protein phosphatase [bacterium]|nr:SpoIIE family protein phosphatase [bacterium]